MNHDDYVKVTREIKYCTRDAVLIDGDIWLPFSLIHSSDEIRIKKAMRGDLMTFRLMAWKAAQID